MIYAYSYLLEVHKLFQGEKVPSALHIYFWDGWMPTILLR